MKQPRTAFPPRPRHRGARIRADRPPVRNACRSTRAGTSFTSRSPAIVVLDCDHCLRGLEALGLRVDRSKGSSAIDIARNIRASEAVREGFDSLLFIDCDMMFDPADAVRLLQSPEPVIAGVYAAKKLGNGQFNVDFEDGFDEIKIGPWADRLYPIKAVGAGFLRIKVVGPQAHCQDARAAVLPDGRAVRLAVLPADGHHRQGPDAVPRRGYASSTAAGRPGSSRWSTRRSGSGTSATTPTASRRRPASTCRGPRTSATRSPAASCATRPKKHRRRWSDAGVSDSGELQVAKAHTGSHTPVGSARPRTTRLIGRVDG